MTCLFCSIVAGEASAHVVLDTADVLAFLDIHPVFKGHVLVVPKQHVVTLPDLSSDQLTPVFGAVQRIGAAIQRGLGAD